ncbi:MAG: cardiolipin synthase [Ruminococcaceae bacterium]|nr:cardiolipin synthase [Oscillospiraceae bacterium]
MDNKFKKLRKLARSRVFIVGSLILVQFAIILVAALGFTRYFVVYYSMSYILGIVFVLKVISKKQTMAYKLAWTVIILLFPPFGAAIYTIFRGNHISERVLGQMRNMTGTTLSSVERKDDVLEELDKIDKVAEKQAEYIRNTTLCPTYKNCVVEYYPSGETLISTFEDELEKAERYIFLEYFIIDYGEMWDRIHAILRRKVAQGVDVRVIYDDVGSILTLDKNFDKSLEAEGIKCKVFHRFSPILTAVQNNRNHRKICVIDGKTAFTGGINIADEYINTYKKHGYWKDNAVMVKGEAAWSFTVMFLSMWDYLNGKRDETSNYDGYKPSDDEYRLYRSNGYVQPYTDNPLDDEPVGENVYLGILATAHDYVWITTPYLIIDEQMEQAICKAVKSGVDVRIVTPGIPDKKIVNETTKSYYPNLIKNGVKIYEYEPGFIHAKTFLCDDKVATVGSVNLDYRSLYLHFECGVWMYGCDCIKDIKSDFEEIFANSSVPQEKKCGLIRRVWRAVLEFLAPLM